MNNKIIVTVILLILGLGIGLALDQGNTNVRPEWVHNVQWQGDRPDNAGKIEELLFLEIAPYKTEYELVNISTKGDKNKMDIKVTATTLDSEIPDIYDFVFENNDLLMTGYLLEAIPAIYRNDAIGIALTDRDLATSVSVSNPGVPSVKRILPKTSEKFYLPKTLLSVSWKGISALVDPDERKVVQVWKEGTNTNIKQ
ncbi:MAG TPA: hypothetical protein VIY97_04265 [Candidatus Methanoperedens sp.]